MSVTTVLVPMLEAETRELLAGQRPDALVPRAKRLRARVSQIDGIRDELHAVLFPMFEDAHPPKSRLAQLMARISPPKDADRMPGGYDPFVHLFGRSLPVDGDSPRSVAQRLVALLAMDDAAFLKSLGDDALKWDERAAKMIDESDAVDPGNVAGAIESVRTSIAGAKPVNAWTAATKLSAWSWPIWRLDGDLLGDFMTALGIAVKPESAAPFFGESAVLPERLPSFSVAGPYISADRIKMLAGSLRFQASTLVRAARRTTDDPDTSIRNLRLLSEAVFFCEEQQLALVEAAGVEWHDRS